MSERVRYNEIDQNEEVVLMSEEDGQIFLKHVSQAFLRAEFVKAAESEDEETEKLLYLQYQQAILRTLAGFEPSCEADAHHDLTLLKWRLRKLLKRTENYIATVAALPMERVEGIIAESWMHFGDIAGLCQQCQQQIEQTILSTFRELREHR